jgi:glycine/D-amino acid oxidase-like deaminating enzyme
MESPTSGSFPVPNATRSYWQYEGSALDIPQSDQELPAHCDVLIIGGGYAGVATAYHLLKDNTAGAKPNVVLLEAREACSGATGRNGGHLRPDLTGAPGRLVERYGAEAAAAVARFELDNLAAISRLIHDEGIDCDFVETSSFEVFTTREQVTAARKRFKMLQAEKVFTDLLAAVQFHEGEDTPDRTGVKEAEAYISSPAAHLSPYKLAMGLLSRALELGLRLKTQTPVLSICPDTSTPVKDSHRITTPQGDIVATKIVLATNAYTSALLPEYAAAIVPCKGLACHIVPTRGSDSSSASPLPSSLPRLPVSSMCIREQQGNVSGYNYLVQRTDGAIVAGGAHHTYKADLASWYGNADDSQLISPAREYFSSGFTAQVFAGWDEDVVRPHVDRVWTGIMGYSADSLPHVGAVPGRDCGLFVLAGFHGHGMPVAFLAAKAVAGMVLEGKAYEETGLPAVYETTRERLAPRFDDILGRPS